MGRILDAEKNTSRAVQFDNEFEFVRSMIEDRNNQRAHEYESVPIYVNDTT